MQDDPLCLPEGDFLDAVNAPTAPPQASVVEKEPQTINTLPVSFVPGAGLLTLNGGGDRPEASTVGNVEQGVWSSSSSAGPGLAPQVFDEFVSVSVSTWNLAGAGKKKVKGIVATVFEHDIMAVQEYPKQAAGWRTVDHGRMHAVLYQDTMMYRAVGVMYDKHKFRVRKRKWSNRGVWVLLEHLEGGRELWIGSLHLPVNEVRKFIGSLMNS